MVGASYAQSTPSSLIKELLVKVETGKVVSYLKVTVHCVQWSIHYISVKGVDNLGVIE